MKSNFSKITLTYFVFVLILLPKVKIFSQIRQLHFEHILAEEGPAKSLITDIYQDREGYMWFGTYDGLYKYDGYKFIAYKNKAFDSSSISGNYIQTIIEDSQGHLWIGTQSSGISEFNKMSDSFINYLHNPKDKNSLSNNRIWSIAEDSHGHIWIGTSRGLDLFDPENKKFTHYSNSSRNQSGLSRYAVNAIHEDKNGILWLGTFGDGIKFLNLKKFYPSGFAEFGTLTFQYKDKFNSGLNRIKDIMAGHSGNLWLATYGGLINLNTKNKSYSVYLVKTSDNDIPNQNALLTLAEDAQGHIWAGSHNSGLCLFNKNTGTFRLFGINSNPATSISDVYVPALFIDRTGIMWIGTGRGINKVLPYYDNFLNLSHIPSDPSSLSSNEINTIFEDSEGRIWIGTWGGGLNEYNKENQTFTDYKYNRNNANSLPDNTVWCICEDPDKNLLIGTYSGLTKFNPTKRKFTREYRLNSKLSHNNISALLYDSYGDLWIGTYGGGLNRIPKDSKKLEYYKFDPNKHGSLSDNFVTTLFQDKNGTLWIGTHAGGLDSFNRNDSSFTNYQYNPSDPHSIGNNNIRCITEDKSGNLWIGTWGGGLNMMDPKTKKFYHYTEKNGLANNLVFGILQDKSGNLWISTNRGLSKFNLKTKEFKNFHEEDGLGSEQFSYGFLESSDGHMYFGGTNGLSIFDPNNLKMNTHLPPVVITSFKENNVPINLKEELSGTDMISMDYLNNEFTVGFASLDYTRPSKNNYSFKLEGYDKNWIFSQNVHSAHYTNIPPGIYRFHVKASNNDNVWNVKGASVIIEIIPPFWDTTWFKASGILLLILLAYLAYRLRVKTIASRNEMLEELVGRRTKELESEITVRKKAEDALRESEAQLKILNANKDKFFSIISHDLKSPFFSLLGYGSIMENDFDTFSKEEIKDIIISMNKLIRKLSDLTENLLQWSKVQTGRISYDPQVINVKELIEKPLSLLALSAENKNIKIINNIDCNCMVNVDLNMISSVIQNLVTNAIKFSKPGDSISLYSKASNGYVELSISDKGVGINEENLKRLFKIEKQFTTKGTMDETGSGLGLILCKEFVEKNGGIIWAESSEGKGATFKFTMPVSA